MRSFNLPFKIFILPIIFILLFSSQNIFAQSGWQWQNPLPQGNDLWNVKFINSKTGYATGSLGTVIKTSNGGLNWNLCSNCGGALYIEYLSVLNSETIYVAGAYYNSTTNTYSLYKSTNGGNNWVLCNNNLSSVVQSLWFVNQLTGFILDFGGTIYKTMNGGINWVVNRTSPDGDGCDMYFINDQTGFATFGFGPAYNKYIIKTSNQGLNWITVFQRNQYGEYTNLNFINSLTGYVYSESSQKWILKTTNGGNNWDSTYTVPTQNFGAIMRFSQGGVGYVSDNQGNNRIYKTTNDGVDWSYSILDGAQLMINFPTIDTGYAVGLSGVIFKTSNSGINWFCQSSQYGNLGSLTKICFTDDITGYIIGDSGSVFKTTNSGFNWEYSKLSVYNLSSIDFINNQTGFISSYGLYPLGSRVYKTINGGNTWDTTLFTTVSYNTSTSLKFLNDNTGFFTYPSGVYKTTNMGENWNHFEITGTPSGGVGDILFVNMNTGFIWFSSNVPPFSTWSVLYKTTNGGTNWIQNYYSNGVLISSIKFINENTGYIKRGAILKTTNSGQNWFTVLNNSDCSEVKTLPPNTVYSGSYKSTNGGSNWTLYNTKTSINSIEYLNQNTGILVGSRGAGILRTTDGGEIISIINPISSNIPKEFSLHQNYPNPFNPTTKINFDLKSSAFTILRAYDITGREVRTLVNEKLSAGSYSYDFNAGELPSGVYFYQLQTNEFIETKKMILLK